MSEIISEALYPANEY